MRTLKASTSQGKRVINMAFSCNSRTLEELYKTYSDKKQKAYDDCYELFTREEGYNFRVGNANKFGFTACWLVKGEHFDELRVETKDNSYKVILDE